MGELIDKIKGNINEAVGEAKRRTGEHHGDRDLAAEGQAQKARGKGEQLKGNIEGALGDDI